MKRLPIYILALLLPFAATVVLPVHAQAPLGQSAEQQSFSKLIAALNNVSSEIRRLENQDVQNVEFENVRELRSNLDESQNQRLDEAIEKAETEELHDFLNDHAILLTALREKSQDKVNVKDVVAVDMLSDGDVVVYFEPTL